jgi:acetyltransferase-like isoleucine patch superfamily enzyme
MVTILTSEHRADDVGVPVMHTPVELAPVVLEDGCDIGAGSVILPGVRVGRGAIVGAGAVVTRDVEPLTVVAGVPAKLLRRR